MRDDLKRTCFHIVALAVIALILIAHPAVAADRSPNLLIIHTDEFNFRELGCYGGEIVKTPNIDWLAAGGAKCTKFYATTPVCSPSRAAFVSGLYPQNTDTVTNNIPMKDDIVTFAEILRAARLCDRLCRKVAFRWKRQAAMGTRSQIRV